MIGDGGIPIPPRNDDIPKGTTCQEASPMSGMRYFACGAPAIAIVNNGDDRNYYMCVSCTAHNVRNRGGKIIYTKHPDFREQMVKR